MNPSAEMYQLSTIRGIKRRAPEPLDPPEEVLVRHKNRLLSLPGVQDVTIGNHPDKGIGIVIYGRRSLTLLAIQEIEGIPVYLVDATDDK